MGWRTRCSALRAQTLGAAPPQRTRAVSSAVHERTAAVMFQGCRIPRMQLECVRTAPEFGQRAHATAALPLPPGGLDGAGSSGSSGDDTSTTEAASDVDFSPSDSDGGGGGGGGGRMEHAAAMEALFPGPCATSSASAEGSARQWLVRSASSMAARSASHDSE